jgi:hypothetical protein
MYSYGQVPQTFRQAECLISLVTFYCGSWACGEGSRAWCSKSLHRLANQNAAFTGRTQFVNPRSKPEGSEPLQ